MNAQPSTIERGKPTLLECAMVGAGVTFGWVLHDLGLFYANLHVSVLSQVVVPSLLMVAAGALLGISLGFRLRIACVGLVLFAVLGALTKLTQAPFSHNTTWLFRSSFLLLLAHQVVLRLRRSPRAPRVPLAIIAGLIVCVVKTAVRHRGYTFDWPSPIGISGAALAVLALGWLPKPRTRLVLQLVAVAVGFLALHDKNRFFNELQRPDQPAVATSAPLDGPSVLLVVLDTVRADRLASYGYDRVTTPALDRFAAEYMTRWTQARATAPWTLPSHASLFTGLFPAQHGATTPRKGMNDNTIHSFAWPGQPLRAEVPTLAERLSDVGYRTAGIVANSFFLRSELGFGRGFERWDDRHRGQIGGYTALHQMAGLKRLLGHRGYRDGGEITTRALDWLDERQPGPFFLFLNYFDAHYPYLPPAPFDTAFGEPPAVDLVNSSILDWPLSYDRELLHLDSHIERLLEGLESRGLMDNLLLVITAKPSASTAPGSTAGASTRNSCTYRSS